MAFQWNQGLSVGVQAIDDQHKEIFARVNRLLQAASQGKGKDELGQVIEFLGSYVISHFGAEERLMVQHPYPGAAAHRSQHQQFLRTFTQLAGDFKKEGPTSQLVIALQKQVCDWLVNHIGKLDREFGSYILNSAPVGVR